MQRIKSFNLIVLLFLLLNTNNLLSQLNEEVRFKEFFNKIKKTTQLQKNEKLVLFFVSLGSCPGCVKIEKILNFFEEKQIKNIKIVAVVHCTRKRDLETFKDIYKWQHYIVKYDNSLFLKYDLSTNTLLALLNFEGNLIWKYNINDNPNFTSLCNQLLYFLNNK